MTAGSPAPDRRRPRAIGVDGVQGSERQRWAAALSGVVRTGRVAASSATRRGEARGGAGVCGASWRPPAQRSSPEECLAGSPGPTRTERRCRCRTRRSITALHPRPSGLARRAPRLSSQRPGHPPVEEVGQELPRRRQDQEHGHDLGAPSRDRRPGGTGHWEGNIIFGKGLTRSGPW